MRGRHFAATSLLWLAAISQAKHNLVLGQPHLAHEHRRHVEPRATFSMNVSSCPGYTLSDVRDIKDGITGKLSRNGPSCNAYGNDIQDLVLEVTYESSSRLHVNIYDYNRNHFTVPKDVVVPPGATAKSGKPNSDFEFHYDASPFAFWVTRRGASEDAAPVFDTRISSLPKTPIPAYVPGENRTALDGFPLVFEDAYLQIASALPYNANIYGLGEVVANSGIRRDIGVDSNGTIQTNWARDIADPVDENVYGVHPFYMEHRSDGKSESSTHGVFLNSAAGADILLLSPPGTEKSLIEYRLIGGVLDFYFFSGPTPQAVVEQYSEVVGQPTWMPLWSFGNNLCRWGYSTVNETWDVVRRMKAAEIPLEVMWNDIDLYLAYRDFTSDPTSFSGDQMREFTDYLHSQNQYYIPIVDAAIPKTIPNGTDYYGPYEVGKELGVFITNPDGSEYIGQVWPGYTVFPDWFAPNTQNWWTDAMKNWSKAGVQFDGIWLDMNEASSFCDGSCGTGVNISNTSTPFILPGQPGNLITDFPECYNGTISGYSGNITVNGTLTCDVSTLSGLNLRKREVGFEEGSSGIGFGEDYPGVDINEPPYAIKNGNGRLSVHALATNATHHGNYTELDTHNLWGTMEEMATHKALQEIHPGKRPFAISRSTFAGAGKFTGHWLGDNFSKWSYLHYSIQGVLQFQFFQIPMVGADACGFNGNTDEELCNRWMQLAAFTPFMRNHNIKGAISQEPYVWDSVAEASRAALHERYRLLPYWYSLFANASMRGTPPVRPLFFEFPNESELFGVDRQFLIGSDILVTPVLAPNSSSVTGYLPGRGASTWRDWFTHAVVEPSDKTTGNVTLDAPLGHINVHIRDGSALLLFKEPGYTTTETSKGPYELLVHLASDGYAKGHAYVDDGISYPPGPSRNIYIDAKKGGMKILSSGKYEIAQKLEVITLLGVASKPNEIKADGKSVNFEYMSDVQKVVINGTSIDLNKDISFSWS